SGVVIPIKDGPAIIGVLEALSSDTDIFDEQKLACIMMMAERLALCAPQWTAAANGNPSKRGQQRTVYEPADHGSAAKRVFDDFDLQRVLESVYVVQQHQGTFSADDPVGPEELIDQQRVLGADQPQIPRNRSEEHTSELQSL